MVSFSSIFPARIASELAAPSEAMTRERHSAEGDTIEIDLPFMFSQRDRVAVVPYFLAKLVVSALSGNMLERWCPEYPPGEPNVGQRIASGDIGFWDSPYVMWVILGGAALFGVICAILGKGWFTKGAHFDAENND